MVKKPKAAEFTESKRRLKLGNCCASRIKFFWGSKSCCLGQVSRSFQNEAFRPNSIELNSHLTSRPTT